VIAAWAAFCLALRVYSCDISVEPGYYAMLDPEATTVAVGAIESSSARSPFPPAVRPSGLARHADVDQHSAEAVRPARGTATPVSVDTLLVTQLSRGKKALNLTLPINGITIRLCSVTLVSTLYMVLNFGLSGQRAQNAIHSLPPLQPPICHEAIPRGFDREKHRHLFFKMPIVRIPIAVKERNKKHVSHSFCQNSKRNKSQLELFVICWALFSRMGIRSRTSSSYLREGFQLPGG
jgi:hypothetical protein